MFRERGASVCVCVLTFNLYYWVKESLPGFPDQLIHNKWLNNPSPRSHLTPGVKVALLLIDKQVNRGHSAAVIISQGHRFTVETWQSGLNLQREHWYCEPDNGLISTFQLPLHPAHGHGGSGVRPRENRTSCANTPWSETNLCINDVMIIYFNQGLHKGFLVNGPWVKLLAADIAINYCAIRGIKNCHRKQAMLARCDRSPHVCENVSHIRETFQTHFIDKSRPFGSCWWFLAPSLTNRSHLESCVQDCNNGSYVLLVTTVSQQDP